MICPISASDIGQFCIDNSTTGVRASCALNMGLEINYISLSTLAVFSPVDRNVKKNYKCIKHQVTTLINISDKESIIAQRLEQKKKQKKTF